MGSQRVRHDWATTLTYLLYLKRSLKVKILGDRLLNVWKVTFSSNRGCAPRPRPQTDCKTDCFTPSPLPRPRLKPSLPAGAPALSPNRQPPGSLRQFSHLANSCLPFQKMVWCHLSVDKYLLNECMDKCTRVEWCQWIGCWWNKVEGVCGGENK